MSKIDATSATSGPSGSSVLTGFVRNIGYEVMPFKGTAEKVLADVPTSVPLTVTATGGKGIDVTLDLVKRLAREGYSVAPHVPARLIRDDAEVTDLLGQLKDEDIRRIFVVGGDAGTPAGKFPDAYSLLKSMDEIGHHFEEIGIGGYPEGHAAISDAALDTAMRLKAPYATRILTQICFNAETTTTWAAGLKRQGIDLPIFAGMPGPVSRQKLMRISAGLGLGQSASFLKKQQNMFWRFFMPGGYRPDRLIKGLTVSAPKANTNIQGFHIFTFNDLAETEIWRRQLVKAAMEQEAR